MSGSSQYIHRQQNKNTKTYTFTTLKEKVNIWSLYLIFMQKKMDVRIEMWIPLLEIRHQS